jgi:hypothetical protein
MLRHVDAAYANSIEKGVFRKETPFAFLAFSATSETSAASGADRGADA